MKSLLCVRTLLATEGMAVCKMEWGVYCLLWNKWTDTNILGLTLWQLTLERHLNSLWLSFLTCEISRWGDDEQYSNLAWQLSWFSYNSHYPGSLVSLRFAIGKRGWEGYLAEKVLSHFHNRIMYSPLQVFNLPAFIPSVLLSSEPLSQDVCLLN